MRPDEQARRALVEAGGTVLANVGKGKDDALVLWAREASVLVYIGRRSPWRPDLGPSSPWMNPFRARTEAERDLVCDLFARHLAASPELLASLPGLRGRVLGCWCSPLRCHGGEILRALEETRP